MDKQKQIEEMANYFLIRNKDTGLYYRGKGVNRWGKYYNQASVYRIKGQAESTLKERARRGENVEIVPIYISKIPEGGVVLTREEHQKYLAFKIIEPQVRCCLDRERELEKRLETAIKETAEKFAERLKERLDISAIGYSTAEIVSEVENKIDEVCKEITEGKV